jgi:hypothetical protein
MTKDTFLKLKDSVLFGLKYELPLKSVASIEVTVNVR